MDFLCILLPYCPNCSKEVQEGNLFCPNCGHDLRQAAPQQPVSPNALSHDISTARTLTLAAMILQIVFFLIGIFFVLLAFVFFAASTFSRTSISNGTTTITFPPYAYTSAPRFPAFGFFGLIFSVSFIISIMWIVLDYFLVYRNLETPASAQSARTSSLVLGILQLIFGGVIPGILLIVAYSKIGESMQNRARMP